MATTMMLMIMVAAMIAPALSSDARAPRTPPMHFDHDGHHDRTGGKPGHCDVRWFEQRIDHFSGFVPGSGALGANASAPTTFQQRYFWCDEHWPVQYICSVAAVSCWWPGWPG